MHYFHTTPIRAFIALRARIALITWLHDTPKETKVDWNYKDLRQHTINVDLTPLPLPEADIVSRLIPSSFEAYWFSVAFCKYADE